MQNLTKRQREVFDWIAGFIREKGYRPSYTVIADGLELNSLATVHKHVSNLCRLGWLVKTEVKYGDFHLGVSLEAEALREVTCPACQHEFRVGA